MLSQSKEKSDLISRLWIKNDDEFEQGIVRVILSAGVFLYLFIVLEQFSTMLTISLTYSLLSIFFVCSCYVIRSPFISRRIAAIITDISILTYALIAGNEITIVLYGAYLWIIIGNGFRFGIKYLYFSTALSAISFTLVIYTTPFWKHHSYLGPGLLLWLLLLPLYVSVLLKKLESAINTAKQANRAKSDFIANMSHELRTPLNAILGYSEILEEDARNRNDIQSVDDLKKIHTAGYSLLYMINGILDLAKIEAGKTELDIEEMDMSSLIYEIQNIIDPLKNKNHNEFILRHSNGEISFRSDFTKLRQILINLLSNAMKFTHHGTVSLSYEIEKTPGGNRLIFKIKDTGIGMSEEQLEKLFEPFVQADSSTTRKYGGTGLGMTISQRFIEMLNGEISVKSEPMKGTEFTVSLPV